MEPFERIVVRAPNPFGDAVMATPLLGCLRHNWPRATITVVCLASGADLYRGLGAVDRVEVYDRRGADRGAGGLLRVARRLRRERFDLGLVCPNSHSSALLFRLGGVRRTVGWAYSGRQWLLSDPLRPEMRAPGKRVPRPMTDYYLDLARHLGAEVVDTRPRLAVADADVEEADELLRAGGWDGTAPLAGLGVGAGFGPSKLWTPEAFAAVGDGLAARGYAVVFVHGPGDEPIAREIAARMQAVPVIGPDVVPRVGAMKALVRRLGALVTTDTGPRHVAVAFDVPTVVIMGPTDPAYTAAHLDRTRVLREEVDCAPYAWPCHEKTCPLEGDRHHQCMRRIPPERALAAVDELLGG